MDNKIITELLNAFDFSGKFENNNQLHDGHINNTYVFDFREESGKVNKYLVQQLNTYVFRQPEALMENVMGVTNYMREYVEKNGFTTESVVVEFPSNEIVRVSDSRTAKTVFASLFKTDSVQIKAKAAARYVDKNMAIDFEYLMFHELHDNEHRLSL